MGTVYLGDGIGGFQLADGNLPPGGIQGRYGIALGDVNNDGRDELAFCLPDAGPAVWAWGPGNIWQNLSGGLPQQVACQGTQLYDMDGDGYRDLTVFIEGGNVRVFTGDGQGNWTQAASFLVPERYYSAMRVGGDADHNGFPDIALVAQAGGFNGRNRLRLSPLSPLRLHPHLHPLRRTHPYQRPHRRRPTPPPRLSPRRRHHRVPTHSISPWTGEGEGGGR